MGLINSSDARETLRVAEFINVTVQLKSPLSFETRYREDAAFFAGAVALFTAGKVEFVPYKSDAIDVEGFFHVSNDNAPTVAQIQYLFEKEEDDPF